MPMRKASTRSSWWGHLPRSSGGRPPAPSSRCCYCCCCCYCYYDSWLFVFLCLSVCCAFRTIISPLLLQQLKYCYSCLRRVLFCSIAVCYGALRLFYTGSISLLVCVCVPIIAFTSTIWFVPFCGCAGGTVVPAEQRGKRKTAVAIKILLPLDPVPSFPFSRFLPLKHNF
jgi:hypothetical protein